MKGQNERRKSRKNQNPLVEAQAVLSEQYKGCGAREYVDEKISRNNKEFTEGIVS